MNDTLKKQLFQAAPILYKIAGKSPEWKIDASDDLFPFLQELSLEIEKQTIHNELHKQIANTIPDFDKEKFEMFFKSSDK